LPGSQPRVAWLPAFCRSFIRIKQTQVRRFRPKEGWQKPLVSLGQRSGRLFLNLRSEAWLKDDTDQGLCFELPPPRPERCWIASQVKVQTCRIS
jgi:hypothetical protein